MLLMSSSRLKREIPPFPNPRRLRRAGLGDFGLSTSATVTPRFVPLTPIFGDSTGCTCVDGVWNDLIRLNDIAIRQRH